ncbi:putative adhesin [Actinocorallia herbida]|uniref:Putative adhesin n=1 Tax=Actinocorallia herbida TaxID=58109 RepID=A0A3N1D907_9ACTN|nr:DUF4097 family beta strand repeat-containing protein [Actinocorallia herbida]ROO90022.1 putative adhesin [Actinocorallia herbida]
MQKFATPAPITAVLNVPAGRVRLIAADRTDTVVEVLPADATKTRDVKAAEQTTVAYTDGVLRIEGPAAKNQLLGAPGSIEVTVQLPAGSSAEGKAAATELRAVGRLGDIAFDGAYHHIKIDEATRITLTATDGHIEIGRLTGPADLTTQRGNITITEATTGKVALTTQAGDITITTAPGVSASLDAGTSHGRITNTLKNDGTPTLDIHATTTQGDITARSL